MVSRDPVQSLTQEFISGDMSRRDFMKRAAALGLSTAVAGGALSNQPGTVLATNAAFTPELIARACRCAGSGGPARTDSRCGAQFDQGKVRRVSALEPLPSLLPTINSAHI